MSQNVQEALAGVMNLSPEICKIIAEANPITLFMP
jgi:hypothetical protein